MDVLIQNPPRPSGWWNKILLCWCVSGGINILIPLKLIYYYSSPTDAILRGANLFMADLRKAELLGANLGKAHLIMADLEGANLFKADLRKAKLLGSKNLTCKQINSVKSLNEETKFPHYLEVKITVENKWTCKEINK